MGKPGKVKWTATYKGFLQTVVRGFATKKRAIQWCRQCGVERNAIIEQCAKECEIVGASTSECPEMPMYCAEAVRRLKAYRFPDHTD